MKEITGGLGVDYSFDAVSIDKTQALAFDALAPGGHAVAVGISATTVRASYSPFMMVFTEKTVSGTFYGSVRPDLDFPVLVDHYMNKRLNIDGLISRTYKLADINEGFKKHDGGRGRARRRGVRLGSVVKRFVCCVLLRSCWLASSRPRRDRRSNASPASAGRSPPGPMAARRGTSTAATTTARWPS